ncbi:MAG: hypothetical protein ABR985_22510 [Methanotrichaceae archaeon]|jgi:hypothetical protein
MRKQIWHDQNGNDILTPLGPDGVPTHSEIADQIASHGKPTPPKPPGGKKK